MSKKKISGIIFGLLLVGVIVALITPWILNGAIDFLQSMDRPECLNNNCNPQNDQNINQLTGKSISENTKNYFSGGPQQPNASIRASTLIDDKISSTKYHMRQNNCETINKNLETLETMQKRYRDDKSGVLFQYDRAVLLVSEILEQCLMNRGSGLVEEIIEIKPQEIVSKEDLDDWK